MSKNPIENTQKEIKQEIFEKLDLIKDNILKGKGSFDGITKLTMLSNVSEGLSDVLLEFEIDPLDSQYEDSSI